MTGPYEDIIHLPHHVSEKRPRMPLIDRAAQFSPFAALTGYEAAVQETARLTTERIELDESAKAELDRKLRFLYEKINDGLEITVTYFRPDDNKSGGAYVTITGMLRRIDKAGHFILLQEGEMIRIDDILEIENPDF